MIQFDTDTDFESKNLNWTLIWFLDRNWLRIQNDRNHRSVVSSVSAAGQRLFSLRSLFVSCSKKKKVCKSGSLEINVRVWCGSRWGCAELCCRLTCLLVSVCSPPVPCRLNQTHFILKRNKTTTHESLCFLGWACLFFSAWMSLLR